MSPSPPDPTAGRVVAVDVPGFRVGVAEDEDGPTGCTVLALDRPAALVVDVRGGAPVLVNRPYAMKLGMAGVGVHR